MAAFLNTLEGILVIGGLFLAIWFFQDWKEYTSCCGKTYNKRQFFCAVCNARLAGPCPACGKNQKWKGSGCMHCGHKLGDPVPIPSLPDTSPSLATINIPSCPGCHNQILLGSTFCGNCGFNLEQTVVREQQ